MKIVNKIAELEYDELLTLRVIEGNSDLVEIFNEVNKLSFNILYSLQKEDLLNNKIKEFLIDIFEKVILTRKDFINKYKSLGYQPKLTTINPKPTIKKVSISIKENKLPRRYGSSNILNDIKNQNGKPTPAQRSSLQNNRLKNLYVSIDRRLIKKMLGGDNTLNDEDCRKISSAIITFERQINDIIKRKIKL